MSIRNTVKQYFEAHHAIVDYFKNGSIYSIEDWRDKYWCSTGGSGHFRKDLVFDEVEFGGNLPHEPQYSESIKIGPLEKEDYTACQIHDCFGDTYWVLLDNKMKREIE